MAETQKIIKWNPECLTGPRDCCDKIAENDYLSAGQFDIWRLPLGTSSSYDLYDCYGNLVTAGFGTYVADVKSSFIFKITGLCSAASPEGCLDNPCQENCGCDDVSAFRLAARHLDDEDECSEVSICSEAVYHSGSDTDFLDDIVTLLSGYFDTVSRNGNEITCEWDALPVDWRCRSVLTSRTDFSATDDGCNPYIDGDCLLNPIYNFTGNRCQTLTFNEQMQLQGANICIEMLQSKICVDPDPLVQFDFSGLPIGKYYIQSDYGCSQLIFVGDVCDTIFIYVRNSDQQLKQFRLKATLRNPQFSKKQEVVYQPNGVMRKIYSEIETSWEFIIGELRGSVHRDLATMLEYDYLAISAYYDESFFQITKELIHEADYEIQWDDSFPARPIATAKTKLKEINSEIANNYC